MDKRFSWTKDYQSWNTDDTLPEYGESEPRLISWMSVKKVKVQTRVMSQHSES